MAGHSFKALAQVRRPAFGRTARRRRLGLAVAGVMAATAVVNHQLARRAEKRNPPAGRFIEVDGVRLHYLERGEGPPLVLLHGNGSMIQDFLSSGLVDLAARQHRVIVFDRPGYGHSPRPRGRVWSPQAQADLFRAALDRLGVTQAVILGHSWGASVALAMALNHPQMVRGLVLASGYYFPTTRIDMPLLSGPAVPLVGDVARHTIAPLASRLIWPLLMRKIFGPAPVPDKFRAFPEEMAVRPSQIRAEAAESALLIPSAAAMCKGYAGLTMPVAIVVGAEDRLIDPAAQSHRLHQTIAQSSLHIVPGCGHMVHQTSPEAVMAAISAVGA
ncbi:alpha/beta fold hydrolase [Paracoccus acridae]|nr:alpha/beta hydrolase [Paracoccus acridae]